MISFNVALSLSSAIVTGGDSKYGTQGRVELFHLYKNCPSLVKHSLSPSGWVLQQRYVVRQYRTGCQESLGTGEQRSWKLVVGMGKNTPGNGLTLGVGHEVKVQ